MTDHEHNLSDLKYVRGSETSRDAAIMNEPNASTERWRVLDILRRYKQGLTDHQMQALLVMNPSTQRPRRVELVEGHFVIDSGLTRVTPSGRRAVVWQAVQPEPQEKT